MDRSALKQREGPREEVGGINRPAFASSPEEAIGAGRSFYKAIKIAGVPYERLAALTF